jgi:hypothetical protein
MTESILIEEAVECPMESMHIPVYKCQQCEFYEGTEYDSVLCKYNDDEDEEEP